MISKIAIGIDTGTLSVEQGRKLLSRKQSRSKYRNKIMYSGTERFDSKKEFNRWLELKQLQDEGKVRDLKRQVKFGFEVNCEHICNYIADFVYEKKNTSYQWEKVVEDVKGFRTDVYKIKKKIMKAIYGISILET